MKLPGDIPHGAKWWPFLPENIANFVLSPYCGGYNLEVLKIALKTTKHPAVDLDPDIPNYTT
jgi:hypothetical protein